MTINRPKWQHSKYKTFRISLFRLNDVAKNGCITTKKYVYENFDKPLSLDILGEAVHLHPAYLSKIFKEETNINLSNYITDIRMQKAAELLEQTGLKVNEIMYLTGYRKSQHFTKLFKEKFGVTPMEYRRKKQISTVE